MRKPMYFSDYLQYNPYVGTWYWSLGQYLKKPKSVIFIIYSMLVSLSHVIFPPSVRSHPPTHIPPSPHTHTLMQAGQCLDAPYAGWILCCLSLSIDGDPGGGTSGQVLHLLLGFDTETLRHPWGHQLNFPNVPRFKNAVSRMAVKTFLCSLASLQKDEQCT